jgi:Zn finger protein HypA/HybF involved in hydrogenase expression
MDALRLDGNAAAGLLQEVFAMEMTTAVGTCGSCGAEDAVGAVHLYVSAGHVLRCPHCDSVLMRVVEAGTRVWIDLSGVRSLELRLEEEGGLS